jgi:hypothetical protein
MKAPRLNGNLRKARAKGYVVVEADAHTLQLDLDGARAVRRYGWQYWQLEQHGITKGWKEKLVASKSKGHVHVYIRTPDAKPIMERIALQTILGSDTKREGFNYIRAKKRSKAPIVLFERA